MARTIVTPGLDFIAQRLLPPTVLLVIAVWWSRRSCQYYYALSSAVVLFLTLNRDLGWVKARETDHDARSSQSELIEEAISSILTSQSQPDVIPKLHRSLVIPFLDRWYSTYNPRFLRPASSSTSYNSNPNTSFLRLRPQTHLKDSNSDSDSDSDTLPPSSIPIPMRYPYPYPSPPGSHSHSRPHSPTHPDAIDTAAMERLLRIMLGTEYLQTTLTPSTSHITTNTSTSTSTAADQDLLLHLLLLTSDSSPLLSAFSTLHTTLHARTTRGRLWPLRELWADEAAAPMRRIRSVLGPVVREAVRGAVLRDAGVVGGVGGYGGEGGGRGGGRERESMVRHLAGVLRDPDVVLDLMVYAVLSRTSNSTTTSNNILRT